MTKNQSCSKEMNEWNKWIMSRTLGTSIQSCSEMKHNGVLIREEQTKEWNKWKCQLTHWEQIFRVALR